MRIKFQVKKLFTLFSVILMLGLFVPSAFASQEKQFNLRVGYWAGYGVSEDVNGNLSGYIYDYIYEIALMNNWGVEFIPCNWPDGIKMLEKGELDVFAPLQKTPEREKLFDYPENRLGYEYGAIYAKNDNKEVFYNDLASLDKKTFGTFENNYFTKEFTNYCLENDIEIELKIINSQTELNKALADGTIDFCLMGNMFVPKNSKLVLRLGTEDFYLAVSKNGNAVHKDSDAVLDGINLALDKINKHNSYYEANLYSKYYTQPGMERIAFTAEEQAFIDNSPVLRVGCENANKPYDYVDEENQTQQGISTDLIKEISKYSGLQFEYVRTNSLEHGQSMMESGEIGMLSGLVGSKDFSSIYNLEQTDALMTSSLVFITNHGATLEADKISFVLPEKWVGVQQHIERNYPELKILTLPSLEKCLDAVTQGKADLTVMYSLSADKYLMQQRFQGLLVNSMSRGDLPLCIGLSYDEDPVLRDILNKSIGSIGKEVRNQIVYEHTINQPFEVTFWEKLQYSIPTICLSIAALLLILWLMTLHSHRRLNQVAFRDSLTGEMNLSKFKLDAQRLMADTKKSHAIMTIDIDKFKSINDLLGYDYGDKIIILVSKALRETLRPTTLLCHGIADRFYLFFDFTGRENVREQFEKIVKNINEAATQSNLSCNIVLSGGICIIQPTDKNIVSIIDRAYIASKQVKNFHESSFAFYESSMYDRLNQIRTIENNMSSSLKNEEFVVYLQPKINISTNRIAGAEALVRWQHPQDGFIFPDDFIPLFEENGFIVNLDFYVLEQVCKLLERWKKENRPLFTISVNFSRRHLFSTDTVSRLTEIVSKYDVDPNLIEVELTESAFDNCDITSINALFDELHQAGFTVSVDDFGAGYSSLALLKDLPIDVLKIDRSFFDASQSCTTDKIDILLESVISLSRKLGIKTVSEGVETQQQIDLLTQLGCDFVQGFYFAKPMLPRHLESRLEIGSFFGKAEE